MTRTVLIAILCASFGLYACASSGDWRDREYRGVSRDAAGALRIAEAETRRALDYMQSGDPDRARVHALRATEADPNYGPAQNTLGMALAAQGQLGSAADAYAAAHRLLQTDARPAHNLGLVYESLGLLDDSVTWYRLSLDRDPDLADAKLALARAKHRRGDRDDELDELLDWIIRTTDDATWRDWAIGARGR